MKNRIRASFLIAALLLSGDAFGYFYKMCVMKVIHKHTKQQQIVVLLGDYHDKTHPANAMQRMHLELLLKKCALLKGKLIVEDLSSVNNDGRMICCNFGINCSQGVLGRLANKARALGLAVDNVEFRYCRVAGIGPLLNNIQADPFSLRSSAAITVLSLYKEIIDELEKIKKYNDGKKLNACYKKTVSAVHSMVMKMGLSTDQKCTVAHYCAQLREKKYRQELENLCVFDSALIDMNIIHSVVVSPETPIIFVIAGGSHVKEVTALLKRVGYELVFARSNEHPQPIDMTIIDTFIR